MLSTDKGLTGFMFFLFVLTLIHIFMSSSATDNKIAELKKEVLGIRAILSPDNSKGE